MSKNYVAESQIRSRHLAIQTSFVFLLVFAYSFIVFEPTSIGHADSYLELKHYQFVVASRWWFLGIAVTFILLAVYSSTIAQKNHHMHKFRRNINIVDDHLDK